MNTIFLIIGSAFILFVIYAAFVMRKMKKTPAGPDSEKIKILDDKNFASQTKSGVTLVDFWAPWCMPCKMMIPVLNELAENTEHTATIAKLNVDENQQTAAKYGVRSIPTSIIFKNGKEVDRIVGVKPIDYLLKHIKST
jgi:thioredoxin 1